MIRRGRHWRISIVMAGIVATVLAFLQLTRGCDFLITSVHFLDGSRISEATVNVGIQGGKISYIGSQRIEARKVIVGDGLILTPGLIDVNSCGWLSEDAALLKLQDGITTYFNAHGDSFDASAEKGRASRLLNYATSVGLIPAFANHLNSNEMIAALEGSLKYGAYTISLSPEYTKQTTPQLVAELAKYFAHKNVLFTFHLRYSSESDELEGLSEAIACAAEGNPVHILHITSTGATYHPQDAKRMIDDAVSKGMQITYDFYPYTSWSSSIHRARFAGDWLSRYKVDFSRVHVFGENMLTKERFDELSQDTTDRNVIVDSIPKSTVDYFALQTACPIGTDSEAGPLTSHPRGVGSFTRFINDYVDTGKVSFAEAIYRFSTATAHAFAPYIPELSSRGAIKLGYAADLVLWNRTNIKSHADYSLPFEPSSGVVAAFVNGTAVILDGNPTNTDASSGKHLKGAWAK